MSIYKQIIFLSLLLVTVMGLCVYNHIDDFKEVEEQKVENIVVSEETTPQENKNIAIEQVNQQKDLVSEETPKVDEPKVEVKEEPKIEKKVEEKIIEPTEKPTAVEQKIVPNNSEAQKELDAIVSKEKINFKRLSTDVAEKSYEVIQDIAKFLEDNKDIKIEIGGHTDAKGAADVNKWISQQRALSVKNELIKLGIDKKRIKAKGYGETQPLVPNDKNGYSVENRRVEFKIIEE